MNRKHTVLSLFLLLLAFGFVYGDSISSSISCDGAAWLSSSVMSSETSLAEDLFTTNPATILRELITGDTTRTRTIARSEGPMGIDEYAHVRTNETRDTRMCLFEKQNNQSFREHKTTTLGLMQEGTYTSSRYANPGDISRYLVEVNGSGILLSRAESSELNQTLTHASDIGGKINMTELMQFGGMNDH